ncbi:MAG: PhoX family phosphatase [Synechococcales cyanobacterium]
MALPPAHPHRDPEDIGCNPSDNRTFADVLSSRFSRRAALQGVSATVAMGLFANWFTVGEGNAAEAPPPQSSLTFPEVKHTYDSTHHVPAGYNASVLIRWGDPLSAGAPEFDPANQTGDKQLRQFGYNNDMLAYFPLPLGSDSSTNGILAVNHEYTNSALMFPGYADDKDAQEKLTKAQVDVELAAHGVSLVEVKKEGDQWQVVPNSPYNRSLRLSSTKMELTGPAAGNDRLKTSTDAEGRFVIGTINNCAGGWTPWGTYLTAEENFHQYFAGKIEGAAYKRYGISGSPAYPSWAKYHDRFDVAKEPNEAMKFGWVVEIDPYEPTSMPKKRTALGRFKHENASSVVAPDGRVVIYSGDDERFDYIYKFVTKGTYNPTDRQANLNLLDEGVLYVAKFEDNGKLTWLPLEFGKSRLTPENGFNSQADVVIEARRAADLMGATKMDRPEDVDVNPVNGRVYAMLTKNDRRTPDQVDAANQRFNNLYGHVIEMVPPGGAGQAADHTAMVFDWNVFIRAGNPKKRDHGAKYGEGVTEDGWFANPDTVTFDGQGRMWIGTDGFPDFGVADGLWACDVSGKASAQTRCFFLSPQGAELCGPTFTPDSKTLFVAVQHPADEEDSTFDQPSTRWPDFQDGMPPRPSVVVITKGDGGVIGS